MNRDAAETQARAEWDDYWERKQRPTSKVYDFLAGLYRRGVIRRALNYFVKKHFKKGDSLLHAGCGSGQVDADNFGYFNITALDLSDKAVSAYKKLFGAEAKAIQGSLFSLPFPDNTFEGVYNLGVMEHFTHEEIYRAMAEMKRVLKPGGKLILFWPPSFGSTVFILDSIHFVLNRILGKNVKLHPDEISRIHSKKQALEIMKKSGFQLEEYYFGPRDLFTQVVLVARKADE